MPLFDNPEDFDKIRKALPMRPAPVPPDDPAAGRLKSVIAAIRAVTPIARAINATPGASAGNMEKSDD